MMGVAVAGLLAAVLGGFLGDWLLIALGLLVFLGFALIAP